MSQFDTKLDYLSSHMVSQELYHHQFIIYFISSAQCQDFIAHSALTLMILHMFQSKGTMGVITHLGNTDYRMPGGRTLTT